MDEVGAKKNQEVDVVSPVNPNDRHTIVVALRPYMRSTFKEVLGGPIPEAWLALLGRLDGEELVLKNKNQSSSP